jgi:hypothetical protein
LKDISIKKLLVQGVGDDIICHHQIPAAVGDKLQT